MTKIQISDINSSGIQAICNKMGITEATMIGRFSHPDHADSSDWAITIYEFADGSRVANTNGNPVWSEDDAWAGLMADYRLEA